MAGYTRQDVSNDIANGNTIDATDLDAEFDAAAAAFDASTGHAHGGAAGEGAPILVLGPVQDFIGSASSFSPKTNATYDLGATSFRWNAGHFASVRSTGSGGGNFFASSTVQTASDGHYTWDGDNDTSMRRSAANTIKFATGGTDRMTLDSNGVTVTNLIATTLSGTLTGSLMGNASTATTLATARNFSITGGATAAAESFNGSAAVVLNVTALNASNLSAGTVPSGRMVGSYTSITGVGALAAGSIASGFGNINIGSNDITASTITATDGVQPPEGTVTTPGLRFSTDTNTGLYSNEENTLSISAGGVQSAKFSGSAVTLGSGVQFLGQTSDTASAPSFSWSGDTNVGLYRPAVNEIGVSCAGETARFTESSFHVGRASIDSTEEGISLAMDGFVVATRNDDVVVRLNRLNGDGTIVNFQQQNVTEGSISVSGTTITYSSFLGSHWSQFYTGENPDLLKGTVVETVDEMCEWPGETNDRLPKFKVSDTEAASSVYGVFLGWDEDDDFKDAYIASLGAFVVRVSALQEGLKRGDLLESAGNGTARKQEDNIVKSSTIAKVTSNVISHTYSDGSYLIPCVLMCG